MTPENQNGTGTGWSLISLTSALEKAGVNEAEYEALLLIEHFCRLPASVVLCSKKKEYRFDELDAAVRKRLTRYPLQYIIGTWPFYNAEFTVSPDCLIPRPDTEILVSEAISRLPQNAVFADLCTGSGCIAVSVLKARKDTRAFAIDLYEPALRCASGNARKNGVLDRITALKGDALSDSLPLDGFPALDAILCNPPYIRHTDLKNLEPELSFEPQSALDGGDSGLIFYDSITSNFGKYLKENGLLAFEIGFDQAADVIGLAHRFPYWKDIRVIKDLSGKDRVVTMTYAPVTR